MKLLSKILPLVFFLFLIILFIFIPFFERGFIFSYDDLFFYPKIVYKLHYLLPNQTYFLLFLKKLSFLIPTWIIQRLVWFSSLFIGALGCFYLFGKSHKLTGYLAGIFFIFNPFVYERMVMGQTTVILGLSFYPWVVLFLTNFFLKKKYLFLIISGILYGIAVLLFPHSLFILGLLVLSVLIYFFLKQKDYLKIALSFLVFLIFISLINFNWLLPSLKERNGIGELSTEFSQNDFIFYETSKGNIGNIWLNVLTLNGHWGERDGFFKYHLDSYLSRVSSILILIFVLLGVYVGLKDKKKRLSVFITLFLALVAIFLAIGKAHPLTDVLTRPFYQYLPFYKGLREPQKWVALILLVYIFFISLFFESFLQKNNNSKMIKLFLAFLIFLPIINTHQIIWGFGRQLKVNDFPQSWYQTNDYLNEQKNDFKVLFLPWRFYMNFSFAGRQIINPSLSFFDKFTFIGNDIRVGNTYYQLYNKELDILSKQVGLISKKSCPETKVFKSLNIDYIILAKEENWSDYLSINNCHNLKLVNDYPEMFLFEVIKE